MICVVMGIPGVGKTTVLNAAADKADVEIVNFGTVMFEEARKKDIVQDRDQMRKLPGEVQRELQKNAAAAIRLRAREGNLIVDTHASIKTPKGYLPGMPEAVVRALDPDSFVLVEVDEQEIYDRRNKDASRVRDDDTLEAIAEHQMINRCFVSTYAELANAMVLIVKNEAGKAEEAGAKVAALFK